MKMSILKVFKIEIEEKSLERIISKLLTHHLIIVALGLFAGLVYAMVK